MVGRDGELDGLPSGAPAVPVDAELVSQRGFSRQFGEDERFRRDDAERGAIGRFEDDRRPGRRGLLVGRPDERLGLDRDEPRRTDGWVNASS